MKNQDSIRTCPTCRKPVDSERYPWALDDFLEHRERKCHACKRGGCSGSPFYVHQAPQSATGILERLLSAFLWMFRYPTAPQDTGLFIFCQECLHRENGSDGAMDQEVLGRDMRLKVDSEKIKKREEVVQ